MPIRVIELAAGEEILAAIGSELVLVRAAEEARPAPPSGPLFRLPRDVLPGGVLSVRGDDGLIDNARLEAHLQEAYQELSSDDDVGTILRVQIEESG